MIHFLKWLVLGHVHKWREDSRNPTTFTQSVEGRQVSSVPGQVVYCTCEICGKPKRFDLK